ncbi:MAG: hypothetical protein WAM09_01465, partial [Anaerolineales bacterium]
MISQHFRLLTFLLLLTLAGCTNLPIKFGTSPQVGIPTPERILSPTSLTTLEAEGTVIPNTPGMTAVATQPSGGLIVRIWLPPGFDLEGNGTASGLLKARLEEFASENPEVRLEVRVKALDGTGGLLESL